MKLYINSTCVVFAYVKYAIWAYLGVVLNLGYNCIISYPAKNKNPIRSKLIYFLNYLNFSFKDRLSHYIDVFQFIFRSLVPGIKYQAFFIFFFSFV